MWLRRTYSVCSHGSPTDVSLPGWQPVPSALGWPSAMFATAVFPMTATYCHTLSARKHSRVGLSGAVRRNGEGGVQTSWQSGAVIRGAVWITPCISMAQARYNTYTCLQLRIMSLPQTDLNIFLHVKRVHFQLLLWEAADQLRLRGFHLRNMAGRSNT